MPHLLSALAGGDALEATSEKSDAAKARVIAEELSESANASDGEVSAEASTGSWKVHEENLAEPFRGVHELVDGGGGFLAPGSDMAPSALLLGRRVRAVGQGLDLPHQGLHGGRRGRGPASAFLHKPPERGELLTGGMDILGPLARTGFLFS